MFAQIQFKGGRRIFPGSLTLTLWRSPPVLSLLTQNLLLIRKGSELFWRWRSLRSFLGSISGRSETSWCWRMSNLCHRMKVGILHIFNLFIWGICYSYPQSTCLGWSKTTLLQSKLNGCTITHTLSCQCTNRQQCRFMARVKQDRRC